MCPQGLRAHADNKDFQAKWRAIKYQNKERLAAKIKVPVPTGCWLHLPFAARGPALV